MRRRVLLYPAFLLLTSCSQPAPPLVGVSVSTLPEAAALIATADGVVEADLRRSSAAADRTLRTAHDYVANPRILAVVGHSNSAASLAASQVYHTGGLVQIAPTSTAPPYSEAGPYSFRLVPSDTLQAAFIADAVRGLWPEARRVALIYVNDDYGRGLYRAVRAQLDSVAFEGLYADDSAASDVPLLRTAIIRHRVDVIIWLGRPRVLAGLLQELRTSATIVPVICADACETAGVYRNLDGSFTGLRFVRFTDPTDTAAAMRRFQEQYHARTQEIATTEALLTYDAVRLVNAAVSDGARTREHVRRYLTSLGHERPAFAGIAGPIAFTPSGDVIRSYLLAEVRGPDDVIALRAEH